MNSMIFVSISNDLTHANIRISAINSADSML